MAQKSDSAELLKSLLAEAQSAVTKLLAEAQSVQGRLTAAEERADLLRRLIGLEGKERSRATGRTSGANVPVAEVASELATSASDLEAAVELLIKEAGKPLHISDIRSQLVRKGVPLPGRGDEANIIVRVRRANDKFVRTGRGTYGLVDLGHRESLPTRSRMVSRQGGK